MEGLDASFSGADPELLAWLRRRGFGVIEHRSPSETLSRVRAGNDRGRPSIVVASHLPDDLREAIADLGGGTLEATSGLFLPAATLRQLVRPSTQRRVQERGQRPLPTGYAAMRAIQTLGDQGGSWHVHDLARTAGCSVGTAHAVLAGLEARGLLASAGSGPALVRRVDDRGALLRWLVGQPGAAARPRAVTSARLAQVHDRDDLLEALARMEREAPMAATLTGVLAASCEGADLVTGTGRAALRVAAGAELQELGLYPTASGSNVSVILDIGRLGATGSRLVDGVRLAGSTRILLDLQLEARADALTADYLDVLGRRW